MYKGSFNTSEKEHIPRLIGNQLISHRKFIQHLKNCAPLMSSFEKRNRLTIPHTLIPFIVACFLATIIPHRLYHLWENMCICRPDTYGRQVIFLQLLTSLRFAHSLSGTGSIHLLAILDFLLLFNYNKSFLLPWNCPDKHRSGLECHPALRESTHDDVRFWSATVIWTIGWKTV